MQPQSSTSTGPTCPSTTTCEPSRQHTHTHTHTQDFSVDLICGGFPCQDISVAGKGAGLEGERSGLWNDFARVIRTVRPRWVVIENVPALTARGLGTVLGDLAEIGFDAEWHCIPACAVGALHRRERIWIVANSNVRGFVESVNEGKRSKGVEEKKSARHLSSSVADSKSICCGSRLCEDRSKCDGDKSCHGCGDVADASGDGRKGGREEGATAGPSGLRNGARRDEITRIRDSFAEWWSVEPDVGRVAHGVPSRVDRLRCLGNAVVPQVVEVIGRAILEAEARMTP